ncbi:MAG: tRNA (adenosine(37)-N6)-threonylcarbamoyltransferase complex transferase subunit TsaD [Flavobacteriales bacterium]|jgi:N6-L-threonylcarbamoyladenine synthase|uniref:tRNA (adenosine(37)-N6)-threonylcarbamoyltransferase complex transferase subunit TsaD n=1 Tax=Blattabacterium sp. (Mastotermes darwiniensis) TaxID=39768 RepID=UPI000231DF44|nr:tRNA (adenosine(37)-N6)-threonylcarbamoyltransferase complex transferase subunit TsaD [Blattabacterium sp. (Mastotermes darwiniensis)]AER40353.1 putative glycoprotease [Blattabacterium sp. (Mastotermes darwiniensis) str. MADAR]MDR1804926.1 tRNA (adenosine(37)-N6)-threonylcarbamoyltransferase complex transferase subunit TsaD [Flavobacteriales bacterium]
MKKKLILGIESSCDDTAVAIIQQNRCVLSNVILRQKIHKEYGGVVPELASRFHEKNLFLAVDKAITSAKINRYQINAVSCSLGPGLMGSLLVGVSFAKSFSMGLKIPLITVNHVQAHILVHFIKKANINNYSPKFPFLCLMISGGHTQIIKVNDFFKMEILGSTLDDSVGEAFDKIARVLGFSYPGGPLLDHFSKNGCSNKFMFSKPYVNELDFSFSGFKSHVFQFLNNQSKKDSFFIKKNLSDLCASVQKTIAEILLEKMKKATIKTGIFRIALAGGVSANNEIRRCFILFAKKNKKWKIFIPKKKYSTDNGAMIAITGLLKYEKKIFDSINITPYSKLKKSF